MKEKKAADRDQYAARKNCLSIRKTPIAAKIIEVRIKPRSKEIIPWIARLWANGASPIS